VLDLDRVLQLITDRVASWPTPVRALGIVDQEGGIERFITSGIGRTERERIGAPPHATACSASSSPPIVRCASTTSTRTRAATGSLLITRRCIHCWAFPSGRRADPSAAVPDQQAASGDFTEDDERLVEMFALHAGIAIENARLHEQVQRLAIVEERERIGRDLHDGIIQSIYAVGLSLEDVPDLMEDEPEVARARVERAIDSLDQSIRDIRNFIFGLRPELLEQAGLSAAWRPWQMSSGSTAWWTSTSKPTASRTWTSRPIRPVSCSRSPERPEQHRPSLQGHPRNRQRGGPQWQDQADGER